MKNIEVSDWHYGLWKDFEKQGLIKIVKKVEKNGCLYLEIDWPYGRKSFEKTFYPESWDYLKIKDKIIETIKNSKKLKDSNDFNYLLDGFTKEGVEMRVMLSRKTQQDIWKLDTSFVKRDYILK